MAENRVDLVNIFQAVTQALEQNQQALDQADTVNQDHGDNMVQTFQTITTALEKKKGGTDGAALSYAARTLGKKATSGSSKLYAQNLADAAAQFKGKKVDQKGALQLLQTLIGSGSSQSGAGGADMLGSLLGGLTGGGSSENSSGGADMLGSLLGGLTGGGSSESSSGGADMLGSLLGGLTGGGSSQSSSGGADMLGSLLGGLTGGGSTQSSAGGGDLLGSLLGGLVSGGGLQSLAQAFLGGSKVASSGSHRAQSTEVVIQSFLQALGGK